MSLLYFVKSRNMHPQPLRFSVLWHCMCNDEASKNGQNLMFGRHKHHDSVTHTEHEQTNWALSTLLPTTKDICQIWCPPLTYFLLIPIFYIFIYIYTLNKKWMSSKLWQKVSRYQHRTITSNNLCSILQKMKINKKKLFL